VAFTVKAQQGGNTANGIAVVLKVVTGASASQPGTTGNAAAFNISINPLATGSWIYGALLGGATGLSGESGTTFQQSVASSGLRYCQFRTTATTTASTPITVGSTTGTALGIAATEILHQGTLAEDASAPAVSGFVNATSFTSAAFTPPFSSLLVLMASSNGAAGTTTMAVTDTSGYGLTWVEQAKANGGSAGYSGVWTAQMPPAPAQLQPIPPGFISPASVFFTWQPAGQNAGLPEQFSAVAGVSAVSGSFVGTQSHPGGATAAPAQPPVLAMGFPFFP
jgi:hypothetical protein